MGKKKKGLPVVNESPYGLCKAETVDFDDGFLHNTRKINEQIISNYVCVYIYIPEI